jgi:hypothetical protein
MPSTRDLPIDALTQQRMRLIVKDSHNIPLVFVFPVVVPVIGPVMMGWLLIRLGQWCLIRMKYRNLLDEAMAVDSPSPENVQEFVRRFQRASLLLCLGLISWSVIMAGLYYYFLVRVRT